MNREKLNKWLHTTLYEEKEEGPCVKVSLRHINAAGKSGKDDTLADIRVPHNDDSVTLDEEEVSLLVNDIECAAHEDAEGLGGTQRYRLLAYFRHSSHPLARFTFRQHGSELGDEDEGGLSEPATKQGAFAQHMRFTESVFRTAQITNAQNMGMMQRTMSRQAEQIEVLVAQKFKSLAILESLHSEQHVRELATEESKNKQLMHAQMFDKANILFPIVINKLAGKTIFPVDTSPLMEVMSGFAESLDKEQMQKILAALRPEQQLAVIELLDHAQTKDEKLEEKKLKLISTGKDK